MIETITRYKTIDGQIFDDQNKAEEHQKKLDNILSLENKVKDALNSLMILTSVETASDLVKETQKAVKLLLEEGNVEDHYRDMYYNSNCY